MATAQHNLSIYDPTSVPSGAGLRFALVVSEWNHAITDALLGAAGLGDIGVHFPPEDARFAGADSAELHVNSSFSCARSVVELSFLSGWCFSASFLRMSDRGRWVRGQDV